MVLSSVIMLVDDLNIVRIPSRWNMVREPVRPRDLRINGFQDRFDWHNLWIDGVLINPETVLLIGPPLYSLQDHIREQCRLLDDDGRQLDYVVHEMDRVCMTVVSLAGPTTCLHLCDSVGRTRINFSRPSKDLIGKRVIVTPSKDHPISWLKEWISYHASMGIDGVLIYDNNSSDYDAETLHAALQGFENITIKVVKFNIPVGPMGGHVPGLPFELPWDSDFSSYVLLNHCKWRYLYASSLVFNLHTDELLVAQPGWIDQLENDTSTNAWMIHGKWVEPIDSKTGMLATNMTKDQRSFARFRHVRETENGGGVKWILRPEPMLPYQWSLHTVHGPRVFNSDIKFGHFLGMNAGLERKRDSFDGNLTNVVPWPELSACLDRWTG